MKAYYDTFSELLLRPATDGEDDSESEEELQSMIQTHRLWEPLHETTEEGPDDLVVLAVHVVLAASGQVVDPCRLSLSPLHLSLQPIVVVLQLAL